MEQAPKTYKVHIYAQAPGPHLCRDNIMSFSLDSHVTNGLVLTYPGATFWRDPFIYDGNAVYFKSNTGKEVYTNLPVIIEEE